MDITAGLAAIFALATAPGGNARCGHYPDIMLHMAEEHGEMPVVVLGDEPHALTIFVPAENAYAPGRDDDADWTAVISGPGMHACLVAFGEGILLRLGGET